MESIKFSKFATLISRLTVCAAFAAAFAACSDDDNDSTPSIKFNPSTVSVVVGETQKVLVSGGDGTYTAKPSDEAIATVSVVKDTVFVKGVKEGKAVILVTDSKNISGSLSATVVSAITVDKSEASVAVGKEETVTISGGTSPYTATSEDDKIATATVSDSKLTIKGVAEGSTTITVTDKNSGTVTVTVSVTK